jgi:hypothetical protein
VRQEVKARELRESGKVEERPVREVLPVMLKLQSFRLADAAVQATAAAAPQPRRSPLGRDEGRCLHDGKGDGKDGTVPPRSCSHDTSEDDVETWVHCRLWWAKGMWAGSIKFSRR